MSLHSDQKSNEEYNIIDGFNRIAAKYDRVNDFISLGLHRVWRKALCQNLAEKTPKGGTILDVSTGSGDVLLGVLNHKAALNKSFKLIGLDPSVGMLKSAEEKLSCLNIGLIGSSVELIEGRGEVLENIEPESIDSISIAWGIRNIPQFSTALKKFYQVLKPGGRVFILESATPQNPIFRKVHHLYSKMIPFIGEKMTGYKKAYEYYNATVEEFPAGDEFLSHMFTAGFSNCAKKPLTNGLVYIYQGEK